MKASTGPEILQVVPGKNFIVPLQFWKLYKEELNGYDGNIAVWLDSNENPGQITDELHSLPLIALNFPVFSDGRSYTIPFADADYIKENFTSGLYESGKVSGLRSEDEASSSSISLIIIYSFSL